MTKHISWVLPEKFNQNALINSISFVDKEVIFTINKQNKLAIQFEVKADIKTIGPQKFKFYFELKKNDAIIYKSPDISRTFKTEMTKFIQSLNADLKTIFDQANDKYTIEINVEDLQPPSDSPLIAPIPLNDPISIQKSSQSQTEKNSFPNNVDINQIKTPEHIFSPIRMKDNEFKLENIDQEEEPKSLVNFPNESDTTTYSSSADSSFSSKLTPDSSPMLKKKNKKDLKLSDLKIFKKIKEAEANEKENTEKQNLQNQFQSDHSEQQQNPQNPLIQIKPDQEAAQSQPTAQQRQKQPEKNQSNQSQSDLTPRIPKIIPKSEPHSQPQSKLDRYFTQPPKVKQLESLTNSQPNQQSSQSIISNSQPVFSNQTASSSYETYCGLNNQGATCYMNSMLQSFYHLPAFRRLIYEMDTTIVSDNDDKKSNKPVSNTNNIPLQLQKLFATMQTTKERACSTRDLTRSFGWTDEDTIMQHDVQEFCRVLLDNLETKIDKQPQLKGSIQNMFRGKLRSYIRCTNVDFSSQHDEFFYDLSLDVKGCSKLKDSFFKYIEKEKLSGKEQYDTGDPRFGKQDAVMGVEFLQFPPVLHLHLRRFEFNGSGMSKINSRFEFPLEINLSRFMAKDAEDRENQIFELFGVLVHSGSVDGGHYYAYLRPTEQQKWFQFDDSSVSSSSFKEAVENNYGGASNDEYRNRFNQSRNNFMKSHGMHMHSIGQRWFSAYMLVYVRKKDVPFVFRKVLDEEIPDEIKQLIAQQEEMKRKKEEMRRIQENTVVFRIYTFSDIAQNITKTNKFSLPNMNDNSIGSKYTALRGEKISVLCDKIRESIEKQNLENENEEEEENNNNQSMLNFEFWPISYMNVENSPVKSDKTIGFPSMQSLILYQIQPEEQEKEKEEIEKANPNNFQFFNYPYVILFVFIYAPNCDHPIRPLSLQKVKKSDTIRSLFEMYQNSGITCKALYKSIANQRVEEIKDIDSTFEENKLKSGSFVIFETFSPPNSLNYYCPEEQESKDNENENENEVIFKYTSFYRPESVIEYFDIICNMSLYKILVVESNDLQVSSYDYRIYFPKNKSIALFIYFLRFIIKIPLIKTIVLYEIKSKKPIIGDKEKSVSELVKSETIRLFQFDQIADSVFNHSILTRFRIVGSFVSFNDSIFSCWMNDDSTVADFADYVESSFIAQMITTFQNTISNASNNQNEENESEFLFTPKEAIKIKALLNYKLSNGMKLKVFSLKNENLKLYSHDEKLAETDSILNVEVETEEQIIIDMFSEKNQRRIDDNEDDEEHQQMIENEPIELPPSVLLHVWMNEKAMNRICQVKEQGNAIIHVFEDETVGSIKQRLALMLNKDVDYFTEQESNSFDFSLLKPNSFYRMLLKNDDSIYTKVKEGYNKLKIALSISAAYRSSNNNVSGSSSFSHSSRKDDSVVIKN